MKNKFSQKQRTVFLCIVMGIFLVFMAILGLFAGKYPLTLEGLLSGDEQQWNVFLTLRFTRVLIGAIGGFALGVTGFVYQTVFRNPLASPDIIGVSSGASAGAAAGILFLSGTLAVTASSFVGALMAVVVSLLISSLDRYGKNETIIMAGIAVHALAQTVLMLLKITADPEKELASIEYWIMGSLNGISIYSVKPNIILCIICLFILFLLHRQIILLSAREDEAKMLGVLAGRIRLVVLLVATLALASITSITGLISFVGVLAPHGARLLTGNNKIATMLLSGLIGGIILCGADILARCVSTSELPVSIFTSLIGAPFLISLIVRRRRLS